MNTYIKKIPKVLYDYTLKTDKTDYVHVTPDIATKVTMYLDPLSVSEMTEEYIVLTGETPEIVADKYYGDPSLHWTILFINRITDLGNEWPLPDLAVYELANDLYGEDHVEDIHHYEYSDIVMDETFIEENYGDAIPITNLENEVHENEKRRTILLIKPRYIAAFVRDFEAALVV